MTSFLDIQRFEIREKIDDKKFVAIYQIIDKQTGVFYSIERLKYTIESSSKTEIICFSKEANMLSKINHPSILKFVGYSPFDLSNQPKPIIVTEFCSNGTLEEMLQNDPSRLDDTKKLKIIYGIGYSLLYLHSNNIIHCSIETTNIKLDEKLEPKLFNFNSSRIIETKSASKSKSKSQEIEEIEEIEEDEEDEIINIFTAPRYIAPEIFHNQKYSKSSDIYSYSILMYEILSNQHAYKDIYDIYEIIKEVEKGKYPTKQEQMNSHLYDLITRCWSTRTQERPTIEEILYELKNNSKYLIGIQTNEYYEYINTLEQSSISFDQTKTIFDLHSVLNSGMKFRSSSHDLFNLKDYFNEPIDLCHIININDYEDLGYYSSNNSISQSKAINKESGKQFSYQSVIPQFHEDDYESFIKFSFYINKASKLHHPSIVKYIGYSPINFDHKFEPMLITEFFQNKSLNDIIELQRKCKGLEILNDTKKLINIYGIASALSYLHSNDIIIKTFNPENILEDDYLFPKLCDICVIEFMRSDSLQTRYDFPEDLKTEKVSKAGNVYSFGLIIYEMMTNQKPSFDNETNTFKLIFDDSFQISYKQLIEKCISIKSEERPNFGEIIEELKNDPGFITEKINKKDFQIYTDFVDQNNQEIFENYIQKFNDNSKSETFKKIKLYEDKEIELVGDSLDLNKFQQKEMKIKPNFGFEGIIFEKESGNKFYARVFKEENIKYCREVNIICKMNHPSILKFIGYSPTDFKQNKYPVIVTEFCSNGTLEEMLQNDPSRLDDTKKLKIIYGIGYSLLYLHSNNIIHCSIETTNIKLDEKLEPKLFNFNSSRIIETKSASKSKSKSQEIEEIEEIEEDEEDEIINIFTAPRYIAPEIFHNQKYSKSSDIYSYSILMYEILSNQHAYKDIYDIYEIIKEVEKGKYPTKQEQMNSHLYDLITRCWSTRTHERPTIEEILYELKNNSKYLIGIQTNEYYKYINTLEQSSISFDQTKTILKFKGYDNFINKALDQNSDEIFQLSRYLDDSINLDHILDIKDYEKQKNIGQGSKTDCFKIIDKKNGDEYCGKEFINEFVKDDTESIIKLSYNISKFTKLDHPSINKFIGYSPINFNNEFGPIIISKFIPNYSLKYMFELEKQNQSPSSWNMTKKSMNIYGIASAMSYLHSHDIVHQFLHPGNILLDEYLLPKITDINSFLNFEFNYDDERIRYIDINSIGSASFVKEDNVYSFAIIVFEMLSNEKFFGEDFTIRSIVELSCGIRPDIPDTIPEIYQDLIYVCWSSNPEERPTFDNIIESIKENTDYFIFDDMDKEDFIAYMKYIDNYFNNVKIEDFINLKSDNFKIVQILPKEKMHFSFDIEFLKLDKFKKGRYIGEGSFGVVYKVTNEECGESYAAKISKFEIDCENESGMINISREVNILSKIDHPSILKYIGYSPINFENNHYPVIITELSSGGNLEDAIELERNSLSKEGWNGTMKLITIYGIASSLQYLHSLGIIHRDLRPGNVLLDDLLFPKLADFGLSKEINDDNTKSKIISGFKGTPIYVAPEIWEDYKYTKAGDVYAFAFTVFEIMTCQKCFPEIKNYYELITEVILKNVRPEFKYPIESCYQKLIENCWSVNPEDRPTFDEIVHDLETNPEFITDDIDKNEFINYIDMVHQYYNERNHLSEFNNDKMEKYNIEKTENLHEDMHAAKELDKSIVNLSEKVNEIEEINDLNKDSNQKVSLKKYEFNKDSNQKVSLKKYKKHVNNLNEETNVQLAQKYSIENDSENTYIYMNKCINEKQSDVVLEYAINLYKHQNYHASKKYFKLLIKINHPIARYFYGIMKYYGQGCRMNREKSEKILRDLSESGIDLATEFVEDHFDK